MTDEDHKFVAFVNKSDQDVDYLTELSLPCPRSSKRSLFFCNNKGTLYEVQRNSTVGRKACWLVNNQAYKDGAVRYLTPIDPLLVALPIFQNAFEHDQDRFRTLDEILNRDNVKLEMAGLKENMTAEKIEEEQAKSLDIHRLNNVAGFVEQLPHICEVREIAPDFFAYKLNQDLALEWLVKKVDRLRTSTAFKELLPTTTEQTESSEKLEAVYTISNYLNKYWFEKLLDKLQLKELSEHTNNIADITNYVTDASPSSYLKRGNPGGALEPAVKKTKPAVPRSLAKVNTSGMKPINSFFSKKS